MILWTVSPCMHCLCQVTGVHIPQHPSHSHNSKMWFGLNSILTHLIIFTLVFHSSNFYFSIVFISSVVYHAKLFSFWMYTYITYVNELFYMLSCRPWVQWKRMTRCLCTYSEKTKTAWKMRRTRTVDISSANISRDTTETIISNRWFIFN